MIFGESGQAPKPGGIDHYVARESGFWVPKEGIQFQTGRHGSSEQDTRAFKLEHVSFRDSAIVICAAAIESLRHDDSDRALDQLVFGEAIRVFSHDILENDDLYDIVCRLLEQIGRQKAAMEYAVTDEVVVLPWRSPEDHYGIQVCESGKGKLTSDMTLTRSIRIGKMTGNEAQLSGDIFTLRDVPPSKARETDIAAAQVAFRHLLKTWQAFMAMCEQAGIDVYETTTGVPALWPQPASGGTVENRE